MDVLANLTLRWALADTYLGNEVSGSRQRHGYYGGRLRRKVRWTVTAKSAIRNDHNQPYQRSFLPILPAALGHPRCLFISRSIPIDRLRITDYGRDLVAVSITNQGEYQQHTITIYNVYNPNLLYSRLDNLPAGC